MIFVCLKLWLVVIVINKKNDWEFFNSIIVNFDYKEICVVCYVFLMVGSFCSVLDCGCWIICRFVELNIVWKLKIFNI